MLNSAITINRFLLGYARMLMADIPAERMTEQPMPNVNHPAWILGHLAFSADRAIRVLGGEMLLTEEWAKPFLPGSQLSSQRSDFPSREELLQNLTRCFERAQQLAAAATPELLARPNPNPNAQMRAGLPTIEDAVAFLLTGHLAAHLGQLSMWRRMIGLPPLF